MPLLFVLTLNNANPKIMIYQNAKELQLKRAELRTTPPGPTTWLRLLCAICSGVLELHFHR